MAGTSEDACGTPQTNNTTTQECPPQNEVKVLCPHCKRTADNGIRCLGMCVADNDY